jgi:hypothetical protein
MWHNVRTCARPPRCRLCGSTTHTEEGHGNRCNTPTLHICPPRCLHCYSPHLADHADCPLCRQTDKSYTKLQKATIQTTGIATTTQTRLEAGCIYEQTVAADQMAIDSATTTTTTTTTTNTGTALIQSHTPPPRISLSPSPIRCTTPPHPPPLTRRYLQHRQPE